MNLLQSRYESSSCLVIHLHQLHDPHSFHSFNVSTSDGTHGGLVHILTMLAGILPYRCSNACTVPIVRPPFLSLASSAHCGLLYFVFRLSDYGRKYRS